MSRHRTEYDPDVQQLADTINEHWNKIRAALLNSPNYRAKDHHRKSWVKAALLLIDSDIDPEQFVRAQLRTPADASRCQPSWLGTARAIDRYNAFNETSGSTDKAFYIGQMTLVENLHKQGYSWEEIANGPFRLSPLTSWVISKLNKLDADHHRDEALIELRKFPDAHEVFQGALEGLQ